MSAANLLREAWAVTSQADARNALADARSVLAAIELTVANVEDASQIIATDRLQGALQVAVAKVEHVLEWYEELSNPPEAGWQDIFFRAVGLLAVIEGAAWQCVSNPSSLSLANGETFRLTSLVSELLEAAIAGLQEGTAQPCEAKQ